MERIKIGGRPVAGFGVGLDLDEIANRYDPLYKCHNDKIVKLKVVGAVVATALVTAGTILYILPLMKTEYELRKRT
jgi:hypothetical protein